MKALSYLILKSLKNKVLELMKKPSLLVLYLFVFFVIIIMFVFSAFIKVDTTKIGDERIIYLIIVSVVFLSVITNVLAGLKSGSTLFDMADVNQVFVAPISSTTVLFYGIIKQAGKVLLSSLFVFYQSVNLKTSFNFGMKEIFTLLLIMILISFSAQFISMFIYIYSNGNEKRKELIKLISLILGVLFIVYIYFNINLSSGNLIKSIYGLVDSDSFSYIPLVGWSVMLMKSVVNLNVLNFIISFALYLLFIIGLIPIMLSKDGDYYEDVLVSTEKTHEAIESLKAKGSFNNAKNVNINTIKNIKVRDNILGINKGSGAWTIFYKQILEMKRTSRFAWIDSYIILTSVSIVALCYFLDFKYISYIIWGALIYFQLILSIITGLNFELSTHYTFLIPDKSYKKLIAILSKPILKAALDASIFFFILVVLGRETIITSIFLIVAYIVMILLYQSIIVLYQRVFNAQPNKFIQFIVTSIIFMIIFVPIIIATVIFVIALPSSLIYLSSLPLIIIGFLVSAIILTTCRNLFDKMEYTK